MDGWIGEQIDESFTHVLPSHRVLLKHSVIFISGTTQTNLLYLTLMALLPGRDYSTTV